MLQTSFGFRRSWSATLAVLCRRAVLVSGSSPPPWRPSKRAKRPSPSGHDRALCIPAASVQGTDGVLSEARASSRAPTRELACREDCPTVAIGQVTSAEAQFVRVKVLKLGNGSDRMPPQQILLCVVRSVLKKMGRIVLVGDRVKVIGVDWTDGRGMVEEILPRESELAEPGVANVDLVMVLVAAENPPFEPSQVTRFLLAAQSTSLPIRLVINKMDLVPAEERQERLRQAESWGYSALPLSVATGFGMDDVAMALKDRVSVIIGPSGVGKSSLINALRTISSDLPQRLQNGQTNHVEDVAFLDDRGDAEGKIGASQEAASHMRSEHNEVGPADSAVSIELQAVQEVSAIGRGRHTTRHVSLLELPGGGLLADTPGYNLPNLCGISSQGLPYMFPEVAARLRDGGCRFSSCQHLSEPGCIVRGDWERYPIYVTLNREIKQREEYELRTLQLGKKRREGNLKMKMEKGGEKEMEVRLDMKKHRRKSRRSGHQELQQIIMEERMWEDEDRDD